MNKQEQAVDLLEEAKKQGCSGHCVDRINQVLALLKPCGTCGGAKSVPTKQSMGFGKENAIMQPCPTCNDKIPDFCSNPKHFKPDEKRECQTESQCICPTADSCDECPEYCPKPSPKPKEKITPIIEPETGVKKGEDVGQQSTKGD